ncbi:MAG: hypothetical protein V1765_02300 [bacterium]
MKSFIILIFLCTTVAQAQLMLPPHYRQHTLDNQILDLINQERQINGLSNLSLVNIPEAEQNSQRLMTVDKELKTHLIANYLESENYKIRCAALKDSLKRGLITKSQYVIVIDKKNILAPYACTNAAPNRQAVKNRLGDKYISCGEIVAVTSPRCDQAAQTIFNQFKNSREHYGIMLTPQATHVAIGLAVGEDSARYCTIFIISSK